jgi:hypothetical protein
MKAALKKPTDLKADKKASIKEPLNPQKSLKSSKSSVNEGDSNKYSMENFK